MIKSENIHPMEEVYVWGDPDIKLDLDVEFIATFNHQKFKEYGIASKLCIYYLCYGVTFAGVGIKLGIMFDLRIYAEYDFVVEMSYRYRKLYQLKSPGVNVYMRNGVVKRSGSNSGSVAKAWDYDDITPASYSENDPVTVQANLMVGAGLKIGTYLGLFASLGGNKGYGPSALDSSGIAAFIYAEAKLGLVVDVSYTYPAAHHVMSTCPYSYCGDLCLAKGNYGTETRYDTKLIGGMKYEIEMQAFFHLKVTFTNWFEKNIGPYEKDIYNSGAKRYDLLQSCFQLIKDSPPPSPPPLPPSTP